MTTLQITSSLFQGVMLRAPKMWTLSWKMPTLRLFELKMYVCTLSLLYSTCLLCELIFQALIQIYLFIWLFWTLYWRFFHLQWMNKWQLLERPELCIYMYKNWINTWMKEWMNNSSFIPHVAKSWGMHVKTYIYNTLYLEKSKPLTTNANTAKYRYHPVVIYC